MIKPQIRELRERVHFDHVAKVYDKAYGYDIPFTKYKINKKAGEFATILNSKYPNLHRLEILEVGCGTGEYTKHIARKAKGAHIIGIDISTKMLQVAKEKCRGINNLEFVTNSIYKTDFNDSQFDVIYGFYSLHHLDITKASNEIYRILRPGGLVYFCEPNILNPAVFLIKSNRGLKLRVGDSPDEWGINPLTIQKYIGKLEVVKISFSEYILPLKSLSLNFLKKIDKITSLIKFVPIINSIGGSVQITCIKKY